MLNLNPYPWLALIIVLAGLYGLHRYVVYDAVKRSTVQIEQRYEKALDQAKAQAKATEDELRLNASWLTKEKDAKIASIAAERDRINGLLQYRPSRPTTGATPGATSSCTGRELFKEDGLFLTGEAARAEALIAERDFYYQAYEDARKKLNGR